MQELLKEYLDGKSSAISTIRALSGTFNPAAATSLLVLICSITRVEEGDLERELFRDMWIKNNDPSLTKEKIENALIQVNYELTEASSVLGIGRHTLYRKIKEFNIEIPKKESNEKT